MLNDIIEQQGLSKSEAKAYLAILEFWLSPVSKIARKIWERRENTYRLLEALEKKWWIFSMVKNKVKCYYALEPKKLHEKVQQKADNLLASIPELLALASSNGDTTQIQLFEWLEWFKTAYEQVILSGIEMEEWEDFLTFIWTQNINPSLQKYLVREFVPRRMKFKTWTKAIIDRKSLDSDPESYANYNKTMHKSIVIDNPIFSLSNEIIIHWKDKVSIMMYGKDELSALVVKSQTLHNALKSVFLLLREIYAHQWHKIPSKVPAKRLIKRHKI